uniref:Ring finger protein 213 n=1 Tax=Steinernema glaseri TaxID=37863 RepID=A0A1I8AM80_9BILA
MQKAPLPESGNLGSSWDLLNFDPKDEDRRTCTGDDLIGLAYLGELATDKSELDQWRNTVEHLGKEYKGTHHLKLPNNTPQVHVSETQSDSE